VLRNIILYLVSLFPHGVGRTRIMKLLFLVDAEARKRYGYTVTGVDWRRWRYGPFSREVLDVLDELAREEALIADADPDVRYIALDDPPKIPREIREIIDEVVKDYGFTSMRELLKKVYEEYGAELDWSSEIAGLAELVSSDKDAVVELVGRLYEEYRDVLEMLPGNMLTLYAIAVSYLSSRDLVKAKSLTLKLIELLEDLRKYLKGDPMPPELKRRVKEMYEELVDIAARAVDK